MASHLIEALKQNCQEGLIEALKQFNEQVIPVFLTFTSLLAYRKIKTRTIDARLFSSNFIGCFEQDLCK